MNGDERRPQTFSWARRWGAGLNLVITVAAVLALVAMVNYLAVRHYARFDLTRDSGGLSKHTLNVLASLTNTVKVIVYANTQSEPLYPRVQALLKEYEYASPRLQVQVVDYIRDGGTAKLIQDQYRLTGAGDRNLVIFDMNGRTRTVHFNELSEYDYSKLLTGKTNEVERTAFKGELYFTSRIFAVANEKSPIAYYLLGHGEHRPDNAETGDAYGKFLILLAKENNFEIQPLPLAGKDQIPPDCNLLVIAGPVFPFQRNELDAIQRYLEQGGRMLVTFNSTSVHERRRTGLEKLLERWGIAVGENIIYDPENSARGGWDVIPVQLGKHPIVNPLVNAQLQLYKPRSVSAVSGAQRPTDLTIDELLFTGPNAVVVLPDAQGRPQPDPTERGVKSLAVVVEKSVPALQRGSTRIAAMGDSWMFNNDFLNNAANHQFASLAANWLVNQSVLLADIPPAPIHTYQLTMTRTQLRSVQLILLAGMPAVVLLAGLVVWARRRH